MARPARREQGDFLHVLEGGKAKASPAKTPKKAATGKPAKAAKAAPKAKAAAPRKAATASHRPRRQHSLAGLNRAWRGTRQQLSRRLGRLNKDLRRRGRSLVRQLRSRTTRRWLGRQVNWLILVGVMVLGATLAWGSHWLVEQRAGAGLEQLLTLGEVVARGESPDPALLDNPWGWRAIRVEGQGEALWLQVDGVSLSGCRTLIEQARGRFAALSVNGQPAASRACANADNRLAMRVTPQI